MLEGGVRVPVRAVYLQSFLFWGPFLPIPSFVESVVYRGSQSGCSGGPKTTLARWDQLGMAGTSRKISLSKVVTKIELGRINLKSAHAGSRTPTLARADGSSKDRATEMHVIVTPLNLPRD